MMSVVMEGTLYFFFPRYLSLRYDQDSGTTSYSSLYFLVECSVTAIFLPMGNFSIESIGKFSNRAPSTYKEFLLTAGGKIPGSATLALMATLTGPVLKITFFFSVRSDAT